MAGRFCIVLPGFIFSLSCFLAGAASAAEPSPGEPQGAAAQSMDAEDAETRNKAVVIHLQHAEVARKARRWAEAVTAYRMAWMLEQRPEIAGEIGACEVALGDHREGAEHLQRSLESPGRLTEDQRRRFDEAMDRAEKELATVAIGANPPEAQVWVDGQSLGAPRETYVVYLEPGAHTFRARLAGHDDAVAILDAKAGTAPMMPLVLQRHPPRPSAPPAAPPAPCLPGADCGDRVATTVRYVGLATAGTALALGVGLSLGASALDTDLQELIAGRTRDDCWGKGDLQPCRDLTELRNKRDVLAGGATLSFVAAGVIGVVTMGSFWVAQPPRRKAHIRVAPAIAQRQLGAIVHGHW